MSKYTPEIALSIKRDVQKAQDVLSVVLRDIEERKAERTAIDAILDEKRSLVARFEDAMLGVFSRGLKESDERQKRLVQLDETITNLETARDLLQAEIVMKKDKVEEPEGVVLMNSVITELEQTLNILLNKIDISTQELDSFEKKKKQFIAINKTLTKEAAKQEEKVIKARTLVAKLNKEREAALRELARENQSLTLIRQRERDSSVMNRRLSKEYMEAYNSVPRRNKK